MIVRVVSPEDRIPPSLAKAQETVSFRKPLLPSLKSRADRGIREIYTEKLKWIVKFRDSRDFEMAAP